MLIICERMDREYRYGNKRELADRVLAMNNNPIVDDEELDGHDDDDDDEEDEEGGEEQEGAN
jgi:hypothetical protein